MLMSYFNASCCNLLHWKQFHKAKCFKILTHFLDIFTQRIPTTLGKLPMSKWKWTLSSGTPSKPCVETLLHPPAAFTSTTSAWPRHAVPTPFGRSTTSPRSWKRRTTTQFSTALVSTALKATRTAYVSNPCRSTPISQGATQGCTFTWQVGRMTSSCSGQPSTDRRPWRWWTKTQTSCWGCPLPVVSPQTGLKVSDVALRHQKQQVQWVSGVYMNCTHALTCVAL